MIWWYHSTGPLVQRGSKPGRWFPKISPFHIFDTLTLSLKSHYSIFLALFPSHTTQLKKATYFDSLQFIGEVKQKVNKLHMLAKKVLPRFPCILWRKIFFANLITLPRHNMDQLQISHNAIFSGGVGCSARMEGDHLYSPTKWRGWYP